MVSYALTLKSSKFFTNKQENTLLNKFKGIFEHLDVEYFDALVGYFYATGYFKIRKELKEVPNIRILIGIELDRLSQKAALKGYELNLKAHEIREEYFQKIKKEIQESEYRLDVEEGILEFIRDVESDKIQIRIHPLQKIHAKIYIFRQAVEHSHGGWGTVISGSSNLTEAGLEHNFEFNVQLSEYEDIKYAQQTFEELWEESVPVTSATLTPVSTETYLNKDFSPFEVYVKFLIEYFGKSVEYDPDVDMPKGYKKLAYQIDAVQDGFRKLLDYDGFILGDVVGLGKTIIATLIARRYSHYNGYHRTKVLVVHPPVLKKNWEKTVNDFGLINVDLVSNGSLHHIRYPENYDLIIVDEAHKFRTDTSEMFHSLQKLCKTPRRRPDVKDGSTKKKVMLVTATPLNNKPEDIRNQLYLFLDAKQSPLEVGNLQHFFRPLIDEYEKLRKKEKDRVKIKAGVKKIYELIRNKVLEPVIVRRTRTDIRETDRYWEDIKSQGLNFPEIEAPRQILYQLDPVLNELYDRTFQIISFPKVGITYTCYQPWRYLPKEIRDPLYNQRSEAFSIQLAVIMRTRLVKRIDSSFHAFLQSMKRYRDKNQQMLDMLNNGRVFLTAKNVDISEFLSQDSDEEVLKVLAEYENPELITTYLTEDFDPEFKELIEKDQTFLDQLVSEWQQYEHIDPKLDEFAYQLDKELLNPGINPNHKLVVFSESKETIQYLFEKLRYKYRILEVDGDNLADREDDVAANFDANLELKKQRNDYDIVLTTEVLAEGVNLHRANVIVNYDIPWNATRLMQRIGRVNRVGTLSETIYIYNFFPTAQADRDIELNKKAFMKLQAFHTALGEDSQIYSSDEEFGTWGLFSKVPQEDKDERLMLLNWLRDFKEQNEELYARIKRMPGRARAGRRSVIKKNTTLTYVRNKHRHGFYFIKPDGSFEELTFVEAAREFKALPVERGVALHALHYEQVLLALSQFKEEEYVAIHADKTSVKFGPNEQKALSYIKTMQQTEFAQDEDTALFDAARDAIARGRFQKLPRELNGLLKTAQKEKWSIIERYNRLLEVLKKYPLQDQEPDGTDKAQVVEAVPFLKPQIIISESFSS